MGPRDFTHEMDWNDTSNPAVREAEADEHLDFEYAGCDQDDDDLYDE